MSVQKPYWSLHTHSRYSANDALPAVADMVATATDLNYPALGLTDHGNLSGTVQLYKNARKKGLEPLPGIELYVTPDREMRKQGNMHLTVAAFSEQGYRNLVHLNNMASRNFYYKPRVDLADLAGFSEAGKTSGLVIGTGCYFGIVQQTIMEFGASAGLQIVRTLAGWYPNVYVELHNHGVQREDEGMTEDEMVKALLWIADTLGLPILIASDAHYLHPSDQPLHNALKRMVSFSEDPDEAVFPGGPYSLLTRDDLKAYYEPNVIERACDDLWALAERSYVRLPELEEFSLKVPDVSTTGDAFTELKEMVYGRFIASEEKEERRHRVNEELEVIRLSGMAGYILMVWYVCDFMRCNDIWFHTRGSASGSYVLYLIGVTQVDPILWGLRMDRFMSTDRTRPPDVDLDVQHDRRDEVVAMLADQFSVRAVGSHMQLGLTATDDDGSKGSLLVKYWSAQRKQGSLGGVWKDIPPKDQELLRGLSDMKLISGQGTHAAGYIVAPDEASVAQLPITRMGVGKDIRYVTAYGKKDVEALGFCKLDLLGLKTKTGVRIACEYISEEPRVLYESIPQDDKEVFKKIGTGNVGGIFQLEGFTFARGCREMKPRNIREIVAIQALFRPGMTGGKLDKRFLARRARKEAMPELHPDIMKITKETYGIALYQEQIMALMRVIGMNADELTDTLDAVKASNAGTEEARQFLKSIEMRVSQLATDRGWAVSDVKWLVDGLGGYAEYSFNKAHAASYGLESYRTAWLQVNHPLEFWAGMLQAYVGAKQEPLYVAEARKQGVRVMPAHVNTSKATYSIDRKKNAIVKGLLAIKGVGRVAAAEIAEKAPFASLTDLGERCVPRRVSGAKGLALHKSPAESGGVVAALFDYGALEGLEP